MKDKIFHAGMGVVVLLLLFTLIPVAGGVLSSAAENTEIKQAKFTPVIDGTFLRVEFDTPPVKQCGDTDIVAFIGDGKVSGSLEPIIIPYAKADTFKDSETFYFSLLKMVPFIGDGVWTVEIFISNNCSVFTNGSIALKPQHIVIGEGA